MNDQQALSPDESMITGCWEATPGLYHAVYAGWEFVHLIEGDVVVTPDDGEPQSFRPGNAFMLEKGFSGTWLIKNKVYKHFSNLGLVDLSYPPLLEAIFVSDKVERTQCSLPT